MPEELTSPLNTFIFGGNDGLSYEELKRRRAIAAALASRQRGFPKNIGEGLTYLGESIGEAVGDWRLREQERRQRAGESEISTGAPPPTYVPAPASERPPTPSVAPKPSPFPPAPAPAPVSDAGDPAGGAVAFAMPEADVPAVEDMPPPMATAAASPPPEIGSTAPIEPRPVQTTSFVRPPDVDVPPPQGEIPFEGPMPDPRVQARMRALSGIETGGSRSPYTEEGAVTRSGDQAQGKYQIMGKNVPGWTKEALGYPLTPEEFRAHPNAQEITARQRLGGYVDKYGEEGAARAWYGGERGMRNLGARDVHGRLTVADYGQDFMRRLAADTGEEGPRSRIAAALVQQGRPAGPDIAPEAIAGLMPPQQLPQQPEQPPSETEIQQQAILKELVGGGRNGRGPATAALGRAGVGSDAPLPGIGALPGLEGSISGREGIYNALQQQQAPAPAPALDVPQAGANVVAQAPATTATDIRPAPGLTPSREPIPPASIEEMRDPGPPPKRPDILGPSKAQEYWARYMNNPRVSPEMQAHAARMYNAEETYRKEIQTQQANEYTNARSQWEQDSRAYQKHTREAPARAIEQHIKRLTIEAEQAKAGQRPLEEAKLRAEIAKAQRELNKPDTISVGGTVMERPYAPLGQPQQGYAVPPGAPRVKEDLTETQAKAATFLIRTKPDLDRVDLEMGYGKALTSMKDATIDALGPLGTGNMIISDDYRRARDALGNWGAAFLTHVSGAAVSPSEALRNLPAFIPRPGDNERDLAEKAERRRSMMSAIESGTGQVGMDKVHAANDAYEFKKNSEHPPVPVATPKEAENLPPGTRIIRPNGSVGQVPMRKR